MSQISNEQEKRKPHPQKVLTAALIALQAWEDADATWVECEDCTGTATPIMCATCFKRLMAAADLRMTALKMAYGMD